VRTYGLFAATSFLPPYHPPAEKAACWEIWAAGAPPTNQKSIS